MVRFGAISAVLKNLLAEYVLSMHTYNFNENHGVDIQPVSLEYRTLMTIRMVSSDEYF